MTMKKFIVFILALLMLPLAACGNVTPTTEPTETEPTETEPTETEPTVCEHSVQGEVTVTKAGIFSEGQKQLVCINCGKVTRDIVIPATKSIKILAVGNSFSQDATTYLYDLFRAAGVETVIVGNAYIAGCTIEKHYQMAQSNEEAYSYTKYTHNGQEKVTSSLLNMLTDEEWDIIMLQQASGYSGIPADYAHLSDMINYVRQSATNPYVDIKFHMTWAYHKSSKNGHFEKYGDNQMTMYNAIIDTVKSEVLTKPEITGVIPVGTAIQNLRTSYIGDTIHRDESSHLTYDIGRYTAGLTWACAITGISPDEIKWVPASYGNLEEDLAPIREAVKNAITTPFEVTESKIKEKKVKTLNDYFIEAGLDINDYTLIDWEPKIFYCWNSAGSVKVTKSSSMPQYTASKKFTKEELPIGTVIVIDKGYKYRPDGWQTADAVNSNKRPSATTTQFTIVDEAWWGDLNYRAFNISKETGSAPATEDDATHFRIYIPKK